MTRKRRRLLLLIIGMAFLGSATALVLTAFEDSLVFFYSPSEAMAKQVPPDRRFRLGGLVEPDSVKRRADGVTTDFRVTDGASGIPVTYSGILPDLFREGQGVVAEGSLKNGVFHAQTVLAKHDEKYMPPEVAEALKRSGQWREPSKTP
ncbi:MAG: cytochrome c maturation protein CcmE [Proteobacteria bacterium]|nr:cytochrome c maturation protein CcmE [Pseudomonadota bacterium]MBI3499568.1 cytochrome c maturation protein CcmE [Pseudomonadota bacterium]